MYLHKSINSKVLSNKTYHTSRLPMYSLLSNCNIPSSCRSLLHFTEKI